jgi:hypothetical protein
MPRMTRKRKFKPKLLLVKMNKKLLSLEMFGRMFKRMPRTDIHLNNPRF